MKTENEAKAMVVKMLAELIHQIDGIERMVLDHPTLAELVPASIDDWHGIALDTIRAINQSMVAEISHA